MLTDLLIIALAASFIVSLVERWLDFPLLRGGVALLISIIGVAGFGYADWRAVFLALASAFVSMIALLIGERLATQPMLLVDNRNR